MKVAITDLMGINATEAPLQLRGGEMSNAQNLRNRPWGNMAKRQGIESISESSGPVMSILEFVLDDVVIPIVQLGGNIIIWPNLASANGSMPNPDPYSYNPLDPNGEHLLLFLVEPAMRAVQERRLRDNVPVVSFPNVHFNSLGVYDATGTAPATQRAHDYNLLYPDNADPANQAQFPLNNFYKYDLAYTDSYFGNPAGTYAASLVTIINNALSANNLYKDYLNNDLGLLGQTAVTYWTSTTLPFVATAITPANYRSRFVTTKRGINRLVTLLPSISVFPGVGNGEQKTRSEYAGFSSCNDSMAKTITNFEAQAYLTTGNTVTATLVTSTSGGLWETDLTKVNTKFQVDMTAYAGTGLSAVYMRFSVPGGVEVGGIHFSQLQCCPVPSPTLNLFGIWPGHTPVYGVVSVSDMDPVMENSFVPNGTCPMAGDYHGFALVDTVAVASPSMKYFSN